MTPVTTATAMSPADILRYQDDIVRTGQYVFLGRLKCIVLEAAKDANVPPEDITRLMGVRLDFYDEGAGIGLSHDRTQLVFLSPVMRRDGKVGLPDIPDPTWKPSSNPHFDGDGKVVFQKPPMIPQPLSERASCRIKRTNFLVFEPVAQILFHPDGIAEYWLANCHADPRTGTHLALIVDEKTGKAHFYGGIFEITTPRGAGG
jgi:hypothetical protein